VILRGPGRAGHVVDHVLRPIPAARNHSVVSALETDRAVAITLDVEPALVQEAW
jgi:hypothetical protein